MHPLPLWPLAPIPWAVRRRPNQSALESARETAVLSELICFHVIQYQSTVRTQSGLCFHRRSTYQVKRASAGEALHSLLFHISTTAVVIWDYVRKGMWSSGTAEKKKTLYRTVFRIGYGKCVQA